MNPIDLMRAFGAADPAQIEAAAPKVHCRDHVPDVSAVLEAIRTERSSSHIAAAERKDYTEKARKRFDFMPYLLGFCSMAACAAIIAGLAHLMRDDSIRVQSSSNIAGQITEITETTETTAAETTAESAAETTVTTSISVHTLPYVRTTAAKDPSADNADAMTETEPEHPDSPVRLPVFTQSTAPVVPVTSATTASTAARTETAETTTSASAARDWKTGEDMIRDLVQGAEWCAPSFVMKWNSDQYADFDDQLHFDFAKDWRESLESEGDFAVYVQENDGYHALHDSEKLPGVMWFQYEADGYIPEVREMIFTGATGLVTFKVALVPADVHGTVRVYLPDDFVLNDPRVSLWRIFLVEETGTDTARNQPPVITYKEG
ncbi:MAG TPA: hypothetical protein DDX71_04305 [Ruminococcus sp.]|nr:hypothetical protein [Ruminococcus sp.]